MGWPAHILLHRPNINNVNYKMQNKSVYLKHFKPLLRVEMGREMHEKMVMLIDLNFYYFFFFNTLLGQTPLTSSEICGVLLF